MVRFVRIFIAIFCFFIAFEVEARQLAETGSTDGRIRARLSVSPDEPRLSDTILLTLEIRAESTLQFEMPTFGSAIGELRITEVAEKPVEITDKEETKRLVLKIVPNRGGKAPLWPITIRYSDRREENGQESSITIPATELEIETDVTPESASLEKIAPAPDIFDVRSRPFFLIGLVAAILLAAAAFLLFLLRRKRKTDSPESNLTPQEIAYRRIALLVESRLHELDVKQFFIELTGIVRWYIEQQTEIRAPELTTEEFLHEITLHWSRRNVLPPELRDRLRLFLESADMVKFAKFLPSQDEIMLGVRRAEEFITKFAPRTEDDNIRLNRVP